ncbi:MAG: chemotaxis protein CheX [Spirochaetaceae bacterium]
MNESELKAFVDIVTSYFESITGLKTTMGLPFIKDDDTDVFDYTGIIGISGTRKGAIYFTTSKELLTQFASYILEGEELNGEELYDLVGEMTNTISGNMREFFGTTFHISVPIILKGRIENIQMRLNPPVFIIPIEWQGYCSHLAIGLE